MSATRLALSMLLLVYDSPARGKRLSSAGTHELEHFQQSFYDSVQKTLGCRPGPQKGKGRRIVIIDVGSNNGDWSRSMAHDVLHLPCVTALRRKSVRFIMVEPQQIFHSRLRALATECDKQGSHGLLLPFAAWTSNTTLNLTTPVRGVGHTSQMAQTTADHEATISCSGCSVTRVVETPAIDLAEFLLQTLEETDVALLKLDIEGSEYKLLPRLVTSGALCRLSFLQVEWHLHILPQEKRLAGVALKQSLRMLSEACPNPTRILDEEYRLINWGKPVPGLLDEVARHIPNGTTRGGFGYYSYKTRKGLQVNFTMDVLKLASGRSSRVTMMNGK